MTQTSPQPGDGTQASDRMGTSARKAGSTRQIPWGLLLTALPVLVYVLVAVFGPMVVEYNPNDVSVRDRLLPPMSQTSTGETAWLGTDQVGRNLLAQVIQGARVSIFVALASVLLSGAVGLVVGVIAGYVGGWLESAAMRLVDLQLAFPSILLAMLIAAVLGPSVRNVVITLAITRWGIYARVARSATLTIKKREFVASAQIMGASQWRILRRYIFPFTVTPMVIIATVEFALMILAEASLSFLGLGTTDKLPSWGLTIANGRDYIDAAWWISTMPGIALAILMIGAGLFGDELRDYLDVRQRAER